ncbi:Arm DNA-binding domain-containing protein [Snuella lapsa]|uniref:Arm DNA-binding domain-containing protein n=1 Tax=Snuella lapsa TaxID=870481 RepID=A0ABP6YHR5_9FLAO
MFNNLTTTAMRASTTFSVLFWIYAKRAKSNQTNIYVRITVNGKKSNISLKQIVDVNAWDAKNQKMKGSGAASRKLNLELAKIKSDLHRCYQDLKQELRLPSAELVKARYLGEDKRIYTLRDIFEYHNQTMAHKLQWVNLKLPKNMFSFTFLKSIKPLICIFKTWTTNLL